LNIELGDTLGQEFMQGTNVNLIMVQNGGPTWSWGEKKRIGKRAEIQENDGGRRGGRALLWDGRTDHIRGG